MDEHKARCEHQRGHGGKGSTLMTFLIVCGAFGLATLIAIVLIPE